MDGSLASASLESECMHWHYHAHSMTSCAWGLGPLPTTSASVQGLCLWNLEPTAWTYRVQGPLVHHSTSPDGPQIPEEGNEQISAFPLLKSLDTNFHALQKGSDPPANPVLSPGYTDRSAPSPATTLTFRCTCICVLWTSIEHIPRGSIPRG